MKIIVSLFVHFPVLGLLRVLRAWLASLAALGFLAPGRRFPLLSARSYRLKILVNFLLEDS